MTLLLFSVKKSERKTGSFQIAGVAEEVEEEVRVAEQDTKKRITTQETTVYQRKNQKRKKKHKKSTGSDPSFSCDLFNG
jgi:DNA-binding helix-hairpin-helix protein with protein kinase domain